MKQILFFFLRIFGGTRKLILRLRNKTEDDIHAQRIVSGKAWEEFCDNLKLAGATLMYPGAPRDPFQQAEGVRYLTRLTRAGLEAFVEYNDPAFPVFRRMVHETVKMGADNPDNHYFNAQISGKYEYRIRGAGTPSITSAFLRRTAIMAPPEDLHPAGRSIIRPFNMNPTVRFEIILSKTQREKTGLRSEDETSLVMVRQTFLDHSTEVPARVTIENLDGRKHPDPITPR